jgi:hypothetical protein
MTPAAGREGHGRHTVAVASTRNTSAAAVQAARDGTVLGKNPLTDPPISHASQATLAVASID